MASNGVETESKHRVRDRALVSAALARIGFVPAAEAVQTDEYYDTAGAALGATDLVVRLRRVGDEVTASFKGPRSYRPDGTHARVEVELPAGDLDRVHRALAAQGLVRVWRLDKRRCQYRHPALSLVVCLDELPALGTFVELEGEPSEIAAVRAALGAGIGPPERLNYRELAVEQGVTGSGLSFVD